jgi:hypothetical protein
MAERLVKGKAAPFPVLNGGSGMRPAPIDQETIPGPYNSDDEFAKTQTNRTISHSATSDDHNLKSYGKFMSGMAPAGKSGG